MLPTVKVTRLVVQAEGVRGGGDAGGWSGSESGLLLGEQVVFGFNACPHICVAVMDKWPLKHLHIRSMRKVIPGIRDRSNSVLASHDARACIISVGVSVGQLCITGYGWLCFTKVSP